MIRTVTDAGSIDAKTFVFFIWKDRNNRRQLLLAAGLSAILFTLFKLCYPYPDVFNDGDIYMFAAREKLDISVWPIGYSKFLLAFHFLTTSATALVWFQFFMIQLAGLYFYFTLLYFLNPVLFTRRVLFCFFFANPLTIYLSNTIASDTLFAAMTLFWITQLIWITMRPRLYQLIIQALVIGVCFTFRHTAYYYLPVTAVALLLSRQPVWRKLAGICFPLLCMLLFVAFSRNAAYKMSGTRQFSLLTGWQKANNALYMYNHIQVDSNSLPGENVRRVNRLAHQFYQRPQSYIDRFFTTTDGNPFVILGSSPLKIYFNSTSKKRSGLNEAIKDWAISSEVFDTFGSTVIKNHPWAYVRYFVLPNARNYFIPPISDIKHFNSGDPHISEIEKSWFNYRVAIKPCVSIDFQGALLIIFPILFLLFNIYYIEELIMLFIRRKTIVCNTAERRSWFLFTTYLLLNFLFSISATINILRYQYIPMFILLTGALLISETLSRRRTSMQANHANIQSNVHSIVETPDLSIH